MTQDVLLNAIAAHAQHHLKPLVTKIDQAGFYPKVYLHDLGQQGGFSAFADRDIGGLGLGLATQIRIIQKVGKECGATAFSVWCQSACAWYLAKTPREAVREKYLPNILSGKTLAGTGMSNTIKHLSNIEKHLLHAQKTAEGYLINGILPWVSNIGETHAWAATAKLDDSEFIMFMVHGKMPGITLKACPEFCALEGTHTFAIRFENVLITEDDLLADAHEFSQYIQTIKPGFILLQIGMGTGIIEGCLQIMKESNLLTQHMNQYLEISYEDAKAQLHALIHQADALAHAVDAGDGQLLPILEARLATSEATLAIAQSAALHAGSKGYQRRHSAQRRSREALFVAIVTPAIKHLRQDIARLKLAA
ncbi:acyl-CoA dehydrogenase [Wohlfahrtiimonas chitiniclastica]|uniref:acyl-CoA dehydrogenase family protein n=1 Tax=Wohlfahrtiimonas chitiniclastica TaxID=400946 RepID=UPI000B988D6A|nr:acyl-CoA dehydrogenase family protein [Wohlfahrtiimonas chitiniclastica]OYQ79919.1 acyl-CoA dehydrogenase [Wohlfahrtiimonas chitiniclastica]